MALTGKGTFIGIIDSGIDYSHPDFRNEDGSTRIFALWDQTVEGDPPPGYPIGTVYTREQINAALAQPDRAGQLQIVPSTDQSGHGTHVAGIAAGNGRASDGRIVGVAPKAELIVVKISNPVATNLLESSNLEYAIEYCVFTAAEAGKPIAVNISYGNNYGAHNGGSLLDNRIDSLERIGQSVLCCGMGNEGNTARHFEGKLFPTGQASVPDADDQGRVAEWFVAPGERAISVQLWKNYVDEFNVRLYAPNNRLMGTMPNPSRLQQAIYRTTELYLYSGLPTPIQIQQLFLVVMEGNPFVETGIWRLEVEPVRIVDGTYHIWLPVAIETNQNTRFLNPAENTTLTIPATAIRVISVGAYDASTMRFASFSGRGYTADGRVKPDIVAPGVNIVSCAPDGGYRTLSGTSMATPYATGTASLMMEWGIVQGNDSLMYG